MSNAEQISKLEAELKSIDKDIHPDDWNRINDELSTLLYSFKEINYKVYTASLTQSGTAAPVAIVYENTIGELTWVYDGEGGYSLRSVNDVFTENKTFIPKKIIIDDIPTVMDCYRASSKIIALTYGTDNVMVLVPFEVRVYN